MSPVDFSQYQPPGVFVEEETTPLVSVLGVNPTVVALVGPSVGYREHTEAVVLTDTTAVELEKLGIDTSSVVVKNAAGTAYIVNTDYALTVGAGEDENIGTTEDNTTTIARVGSGIPNGSTVYVTYQYTDVDYHEPLRVTDYDDVKDAFGEPLNLTTGAITSPLSLAAKVAFENGANQLVLVSTTGTATATTRNELDAAYDKLDTVPDVNVIVPLPVGITGTTAAPADTYNIGDDLVAKLAENLADNLLRIGIIGYEKTVTIDPGDAAENFPSSRMIVVWPQKLSFFNGATNTTLEVSGYYLSAGVAGRMAALPVQEPFTKKVIRGFSGIPASMLSTMTVAQKNTWSQEGVAVLEPQRDGRLVIRHGVTTDPTSLLTREVSLVRARDSMVNLISDVVEDSQLVGTFIDEDTLDRVKGVVQGALETATNAEIIIAYNNLKVRQRSIDPSVIEVKFQYQPAYPLNYIVVAFSINTITGETTVIEDVAA